MGSSFSSHASINNGISTAKRKILANTKDDILLSPRKSDEEKVRAKEMERTKKWRNMAVIERPNGTIQYRFPMTRKVSNSWTFLEANGSWCSGRSRAFRIVGGRQFGTNGWRIKPRNEETAKRKPN